MRKTKWVVMYLIILAALTFTLVLLVLLNKTKEDFANEDSGRKSFDAYVNKLVKDGKLDEKPKPVEASYGENEDTIVYSYVLSTGEELCVYYNKKTEGFSYAIYGEADPPLEE